MTDIIKKMGLRSELVLNLEQIGYSELTPIQNEALPHVIEGRDVIGQAKTGSGKTAVFGLGILNNLDLNCVGPQALILCPTRELADQVSGELRKLARTLENIKVLTITGGTNYQHQESSLEHGAHIIVGTPGRVSKFIFNDRISTKFIRMFVLDEADRLLDMGFYDEIMKIESRTLSDKQTLLFSATFTDEIIELSKNIQKDAIDIVVDSEHEEGRIKQEFFLLSGHKDKNQAVLHILGEFNPRRIIIFCKTKLITEKLTSFLKNNNISVACIHGDVDQNERTKTLIKFSNDSLSVLVATDVAARGIDISELDAVLNYDLPSLSQDYIHRIGRTARAGHTGQAFSLMVKEEDYKLEQIEFDLNEKIKLTHLDEFSNVDSFTQTPSMTTIFISGGKKHKLRPGDILGALVKEVGLNANDVGDISILNVVSYVAVKSEYFQQTIEKLNGSKIKNKKFRVGLAN